MSRYSRLAVCRVTVMPSFSTGHGIAPMAYAGGAAFSGNFTAADSAETAYSNPAGMTRLDGRKMTGQGVFIKEFSQFEVQSDHNREAIN